MRALIFAVLFCSKVTLAAPVERWSVGTGMELRGQQEVNPQYMEARTLPHFFAQFRKFPFTISLEGGYEERRTSTGLFSVATKSIGLSLWGRYEFREPLRWSPYASVGVGSYFDSVDFNYGDGAAATARKGRRDLFGIGGGISHAFFIHFLQELEARAVLIEDRRDIAWTVIYRLGYVY